MGGVPILFVKYSIWDIFQHTVYYCIQ